MPRKFTIVAGVLFLSIISVILAACIIEFDPPTVQGPFVDSAGRRINGVTQGSAQGWGGPVTINLVIRNGFIETANVRGPGETTGWGATAVTNSMEIIVLTNSVELDTIASSTITTRAITEAGRQALDRLGAIATGPGVGPDPGGGGGGGGLFDGRWFVTNFWSNDVHVICGRTLRIERHINFNRFATLGRQSHYLVIDGSPEPERFERFLWVGQIGGNLWVYDLEAEDGTDGVVRTWSPDDLDVNVAVADIGMIQCHESRWLFSVGGRHIHIFDMERKEYVGSIANLRPGTTRAQSDNPHVIEVCPENRILWASDHNGGHVVGFDISLLPFMIPTTPVHSFNVFAQIRHGVNDGPAFTGIVGTSYTAPIPQLVGHALAVHPNNRFLFLGSFQGNALRGAGTFIIDIYPNSDTYGQVLHRIPGRPHNFAISPDGNTLLVCDNNVALFETHRGTRRWTEFSEHLADLGFDIGRMENTFLTYTIDISSLNSELGGPPPVPRWDEVGITNVYATTGVGRANHVIFSPCGTEFHVTYDGVPNTTGAGPFKTFRVQPSFRDTGAAPRVIAPHNTLRVGLQPHAIAKPGLTR